MAKKCNPNVVTLQGGTNFPMTIKHKIIFIGKTSYGYIFEGENSQMLLAEFVSNKDRKQSKKKLMDVFIHPDTKNLTSQFFQAVKF